MEKHAPFLKLLIHHDASDSLSINFDDCDLTIFKLSDDRRNVRFVSNDEQNSARIFVAHSICFSVPVSVVIMCFG